MKIRLLSDLHIEHTPYHYQYANEDVLVLAGDIDIRNRHINFLKTIPENVAIVFITGNHSYYSEEFNQVNKTFSTLQNTLPNFTFLMNNTKEIDNIAFFGGTMFSNFMLYNTPYISRIVAQNGISDFHHIRIQNQFEAGHRKWTTEDHITEYHKFESGLNDFYKQYAGQKRIVISHFAPSELCSLREYIGDDYQPYFVSNMHNWLGDPDVIWLHGHLHNTVNITCGDTRVFCNPRGYSDNDNWKFNPNLIIEV